MLEIKRATLQDAQIAFDIRLRAIRSQCIGAYTHEQMMMWTRGKAEDGYSTLMDKLFYLGWVQGQPVVTGMLDLDNHEVGALFVLPGFTGCGYGKAMLDHLENVARELAIEEVVLDATLNAAGFYRACGYVGDEQAIYHSPSGLALACIAMTKPLNSSAGRIPVSHKSA
ncbi:GNAT family N-acetyltransferase [Pseudomonas marginalis]|nr:GNAT family N-acetyltransferase [Pseudomonas marginalis]OAJ47333.1 GCN5 family acetyltransferase [Pseudomonas marginalis]